MYLKDLLAFRNFAIWIRRCQKSWSSLRNLEPRKKKREFRIDKINSELSSAETRIILKPLLLRLVDRFLLALYRKRPLVKAINPDELAARWCVFLEHLVEGCIEAIQRGKACRISVAEYIHRE